MPFLFLLALMVLFNASLSAAPGEDALPSFRPAIPEALPELFVWSDTCNAYVLRDGDAALLINLGDGSVLDHLSEIGVKRVEWVLFTDHHREECQGGPRLKDLRAKIAAPEAERAQFETPAQFRKMKPSLTDPFTVHGASFVRPPVESIPLDRGLARPDTFVWHGYEFACIETKGTSPGGMSFILRRKNHVIAFSGDVMLDGARMHNWFDTEWDYSFGAGLYALAESVSILQSEAPTVMLPSHGPPVPKPVEQLATYEKKLRHALQMVLRTYSVVPYVPSDQDRISKPTDIPNLRQVSAHLFKFKGSNYIPNFSLILSDTGHALVVDCGRVSPSLLDQTVELMQKRMGLKQVDAVVVTHMHGDHLVDIPHLVERWGAKVWTLDRVAEKCEHPERFDYAAMVESYGAGVDSVKVDRRFNSGETLNWEGYKFTFDWMPGQTEFAMCLHGEIDGQRVAFTGDNIFGNPNDPKQNGHEAIVARNSAILEEGYLYGAAFLSRLKPDVLMGAHGWVMDRPAAMIERYQKWAVEMKETLRGLSVDEDYRYGFDPYWVRAEPYRTAVEKGGELREVVLHVRNFRGRAQSHHIGLHVPNGIVAEPAVLDGKLGPDERGAFVIKLHATPAALKGVNIVAFDATIDGHRYGEWFDCIVNVD